ncbi:MAG TPA: DsbA family oxidoreductase [Burkholderiaceae bacterium]|jgi:predicted DsbA family dithiol-disulfide isomerase|nr:DsbA family oxidoreductase [Burkholderiaceae bacterium]
MRIDVVSDVVCPWCFIGKRQLEAAIAAWSAAHPEAPLPEVVWHPFQLNPFAPAEGVARDDYLRSKFGTADTTRLYSNVRAAASEVSLPLALDRIARQPNTLRPHALMAAAFESGGQTLQSALAEALFSAYFQESRNLSDPEVLSDIARKAGVPDADIVRALSDEALLGRVADEDQGARDAGIGGVPYFVVNGRVAVNGAQGEEALLRAFRRAATLPEAPFALRS